MDEKKTDRPDWNDLRLFLAVAREGGLSPAARAAGSSPATLARRMLALERRLGRELFVRHERGYALTDGGRALLGDLGCRQSGSAGAQSRLLSHDVHRRYTLNRISSTSPSSTT